MNTELENKDCLSGKGKIFNKYFVTGTKNNSELSKEKLLSEKVLDFYNKVYGEEKDHLTHNMFDYDFHSFGYLDDYGYYTMTYDGGNYYIIHNHKEDLDEAFVAVARNILARGRRNELYQDKRTVKKEYKKDYRMKYFDTIYQAKYDLDKWNIYYDGNIPKKIIDMYEDYMNMGLDNSTEMKYNHDTKKIMVKKRSL